MTGQEAVIRDPFDNGVLERLARSNQDYQRTHGNYIVPLAERLLAERARVAALVAERDALSQNVDELLWVIAKWLDGAQQVSLTPGLEKRLHNLRVSP